MKTLRSFSRLAAGLLLLLLGVSSGRAEPAAADRGAAAADAREFAAVEQFLGLDDAELDEIIAVIQRIRAMSPEQRAALRRDIAAFRRLPEPTRRELRQGWGQVEPALRDGWREMMHAASAERRSEIHAKLQALAPEQRLAYRRQLVEEFLAQRGERTGPASPKK